MIKINLIISSFFISTAILAQGVKNVGIGTTKPDQSAVLDIQSTEKGLLIPRLTNEQKVNISNPAKGLLIYQTDQSSSGFFFFNGEKWSPLSNNDAYSVATADINGWALDGNLVASATKAAATTASFIGVPAGIPINFKMGTFRGGVIETNLQGRNTSFGYSALNAMNVATTFNIAFGAYALRNLNSGSNNFAIGVSALESKTSGSSNMALGTAALLSNISGSRNTAIGNNAGFSNTGSDNLFIGNAAGQSELGSNKLYISNTNTANPLIKGDFSANNLQVNSKTTGYLAIGDFTTATSGTPGTGGLPLPANVGLANGYRLVVQDGILCEKVKVALRATGSADWADYVFEPEYKAKMMSLEEVEEFTLKNKHLPNVPTTEQVQKEGLDMHQTSKMFMEKIEELTLYLIELNKEVKALKAENNLLKEKK